MYVQYQRPGRQLREQAPESPVFGKRQTSNGGSPGGGGRFTLTGPITITITRQTLTRLPFPTTIESISLTQTQTQTSLLTTGTNSPPTILPTSTAAPVTPTIPSLPSPPVTPASRTPTSLPSPVPTNTESGIALQNNAATSSAITGGAIAGIVISCVFLVGTVLFFVWRTRSRKRRRKNRAIWATSTKLNMPAPVSDKDYRGDGGTYQFSTPPMAEKKIESPTRQLPKRVPVPQTRPEERPTSDAFDSGLTSPIISTFNSETFLSARYNPTYQKSLNLEEAPPQILSPFSAKVLSTFVPNLPDELRIELDEVIRVLAEYDDGWALCMNSAGEQGMVPLECLDRGDSGVSLTRRSTTTSGSSAPVSLAYLSRPDIPTLERRGSKRLSSLDPTAQPLKTYSSV